MISGDDIAAFEGWRADGEKVDRVLKRWKGGIVKHRRIHADEEEAILRVLAYLLNACDEAARDKIARVSDSMSLGAPGYGHAKAE